MRTLLAVILFAQFAFAGNSYHVTTTGGGAGQNGSSVQPWRITYALRDSGGVITAGDTVWVHGGKYTGSYICSLVGTSANPVVVRSYNRERVTINAGNTYDVHALTFTASCNYTWVWGIEFTSNTTDRESAFSSAHYTDTDIPPGIHGDGMGVHYGLRIINCVFHDLFTAINWFANEQNSEIYGNIFYNIGAKRSNGGTAYSIYGHSGTGGWKTISNNITGNVFAYNFHFYTQTAKIDSMVVKENIVYNGWRLLGDDYSDQGSGFLMGGLSEGTLVSDSVIGNYFWCSNGDGDMSIGYGDPIHNSVIKNNRAFGTNTYCAMAIDGGDSNLTVTGNTMIASRDLGEPFTGHHIRLTDGYTGNAKYTGNTFLDYPMSTTGDSTFFLPNAYEAKRGHVVSYNFSSGNSVSVNVSSSFSNGDTVFVFNAMNPYGDPADTLTVSDGAISIDMRSSRWSMATPRAWTTPGTTYPQFGAFLLTGSALGGGAQNEAAAITGNPSGASISRGRTATLTVTASGAPSPTYQWQKNSVNITGATSASYTTPAVTFADHGSLFRCIVSNSAGSDTSAAATLSVQLGRKWFGK